MNLGSIKLSPDIKTMQIRRVILRGAPFHNANTVKVLVRVCVPKLSPEEADRIVDKAQQNPDDGATVIVCLEKDAQQYCRNLLENGLISEVS